MREQGHPPRLQDARVGVDFGREEDPLSADVVIAVR
jgi:hypothetical protein